MQSRRLKMTRALVGLTTAGASLMQVGTCTRRGLEVEISESVVATIDGLISIAAAELATELLDERP